METPQRSQTSAQNSLRLTLLQGPSTPVEKRVKPNGSTDKPTPIKDPTPAEIILSLLRQDINGKYCNVHETLSSVQVLKLAYEVIKSKPGNMVRGTTKKTLDGITAEWFEKTSRALRKENFKFKPNRRVYIPKPNGKLRPLGIASPRDKIVQQAMLMVMETVLVFASPSRSEILVFRSLIKT